nr:MAG TPA: hypothetical protein [Caudoviricetes sp.]
MKKPPEIWRLSILKTGLLNRVLSHYIRFY